MVRTGPGVGDGGLRTSDEGVGADPGEEEELGKREGEEATGGSQPGRSPDLSGRKREGRRRVGEEKGGW